MWEEIKEATGTKEVIGQRGKLAVFRGPYDITIEEYKLPEVKEDGILIKVEAASICGSDGHGVKMTPDEPCTIGHEFAGRIIAMGEKANESIYSFGGPLKVGDRIVPYPWITCGTCPDCLEQGNGVCMICENGFCYGGRDTMGTSKITASVEDAPHFKGGFAEYVYIFPGTYVWKIPEDMPSTIASLLDPLAVAVRAVEMAQTEAGVPGESLNTSTQAVVIGAGAVGILTAMILKIQGCQKVIVTDFKKEKLQLAKEISGCDEVLDSSTMSLEERISKIRTLTGQGPHLVIQCANSTRASIEGLQMVRKLGTYIEVGVPFGFGEEFKIDLPRLAFSKNVRINSLVANSPRVFHKAFHLLERHTKYPFFKLFTHKFYCLEDLLPTIGKMGDSDYIKGIMILK
ncbi:MAG: alcohol dehydrogenase catalytic domain-containing protein [Eubacteriales bacterium]|nr:alcohol dehydrogenase catalytic domain-containing protein [Eubacteriales bacterium]